jgi:hypothetical protein
MFSEPTVKISSDLDDPSESYREKNDQTLKISVFRKSAFFLGFPAITSARIIRFQKFERLLNPLI